MSQSRIRKSSNSKSKSKKNKRRTKRSSSKRKSTPTKAQLIKQMHLAHESPYDPLGLLNPALSPRGLGVSTELGMGMEMGMPNPLSSPLMLPGVINRKAIYRPTTPNLTHINFPQNQLGESLLAPTINTDAKPPLIGGADTSALAKMNPDLQRIIMNSNNGNLAELYNNLMPYGPTSMFLSSQYPLLAQLEYMKDHQHQDELIPVINNTGQRPGMATYMNDADGKALQARKLAVISNIPISENKSN